MTLNIKELIRKIAEQEAEDKRQRIKYQHEMITNIKYLSEEESQAKEEATLRELVKKYGLEDTMWAYRKSMTGVVGAEARLKSMHCTRQIEANLRKEFGK